MSEMYAFQLLSYKQTALNIVKYLGNFLTVLGAKELRIYAHKNSAIQTVPDYKANNTVHEKDTLFIM